jgi:hypothetical protein
VSGRCEDDARAAVRAAFEQARQRLGQPEGRTA